MRILFHHRIASRDGQAVHLEEMLEALADQGHETILVGPAGFDNASFGDSPSSIDFIKRMIPAALYEVMEVGYNFLAYRRLGKAVKAFKPDFIYERFSLFLLAGVWLRKRRKIPLLLEVNGPLYEERLRHDGLRIKWLARACQRHVWNNVDYVLPVTEVLAGDVRAYGVPDERIAVIPNGINPKRFGNAPSVDAAKAALGLDGRLVLGFTGFVRKWHAMDRVIDFLAEHGEGMNLHLLIIGDGPVRAELEAQAAERKVTHRFTITGVIGRDELVRKSAAFDIALLPGINDYASPLKLFEYLWLGQAVVAPDQQNIREVLTDGEDALLVDPKSPAAMTDAILRLCQDADLRKRIGAQGRATLTEKGFYWSTNATRVVDLARKAGA
ncbi:MAG TPA: glycosyltransferase family 4 protein [Alphaproteobacteria bacterium]|nr:glycosyltransferase family 4 protein [Alphaproteobacteria bacterium]